MRYMVVTNIPAEDNLVNDVRVFDSIEEAKYYKWKQDSEYCPSKIYIL